MGDVRRKLVVAATRAGYENVSDRWCDEFIATLQVEGRETRVSEDLCERYRPLNRGKPKRFVFFRRILVVYEGSRMVDFLAIRDVGNHIIHEPDTTSGGKERQAGIFATAVAISLHHTARRLDRVPDARLRQ